MEGLREQRESGSVVFSTRLGKPISPNNVLRGRSSQYVTS